MRPHLSNLILATAVLLGASAMLAVSAQRADAQNLLEFLFGGGKKEQQRPTQPPDNPVSNFFADPFGQKEQQQTQRSASNGIRSGSAGFCVRTCDGKYFPFLRNATSPEQICQAFCPTTATQVYYGSAIDDATNANGDRYADSNTAFAFRKALKADCTCNGRSPAGLAQVDLTLDSSLRAGDIVATGNRLVAYTGNRGGGSQDFTPVASYPGLTSEVRARLGEMKVSPSIGDQTAIAPATTTVEKSNPAASQAANAKPKRAVASAEASPTR